MLSHEHTASYYQPSADYRELLRQAVPRRVAAAKYARLLCSPRFYLRFVLKRIRRRYKPEGDIHVWPDDHIE